MSRLFLLTLSLFSLIFLGSTINTAYADHVASGDLPNYLKQMCGQMNVSAQMVSGQWPGGKIGVSCPGTGQYTCNAAHGTVSGQVSPGGGNAFLSACDCTNGGACLSVGSNPNPECTVKVKEPNACLTNGTSGDYVVEVSCPPAQPTPTPTTCVEDQYCEKWHTKDNIPADNPHKQKILDCLDKGYYVHTKKLCGGGYEVTCDTSIADCKVPSAQPTKTPTPTPTDGPKCNTDCSGNPSICDQASGGCTYCNPSNNRCEVPPGTTPPTSTPTPTNPPGTTPPTATPTTPGGGTQPPTQPPSGPPTATSTPRPPTATPTPAFDENWCKCDTMSVSQLIGGQPAVFTATGKVEAPNTDKAKVQWIKFQIFEGLSKRIAESGQIPAQKISETTSLVRYQSQWTWTVPADIKKGVEYQAKATIKCAPTSTAINLPFTSIYMGVSDENQGLFGMIVNFFKNIFGGKKETPAPAQVTQEPLASMEQDEVSIAGDELQLGTVPVGKTIENTCSLIRFKFQ